MTQPDGEIPDSAISSLAAFAAKTQSEWDAEIRGKTTVPYTKFAGGWGGLLSGILGAGNNAVNAITQIGTLIWKVGGSIIDDVGDFINAALSNAATAITNSILTLANLQSTWNAIVRGWSGTPGAVGSMEDVEVIFSAARQVQFGMISLADLASSRRRVPFWVSPNPFEYVSFPRALLNKADGSKPVFTIPAGTLALTAVSIEEATTNNQVRFIAGGNTPPTHVYCGLWKVDQVTGAMTMVYNFGDVRGDIDTGSLTYEVALEMSDDMLIDAGEIMAVGILPVGGSFTVGAIPRQQIVPSPLLYPQASTALLSGLTTLPVSDIADSSLDLTATHRVLASVGQALPETISPVSITIDFDQYVNNVNWASPACVNFKNTAAGKWRINDGVLTAYGTENFTAINYEMGFVVKQKCATDDMFAEFVVGSPWTSFAHRPSRVYVHCANDGSAAVGLFITQTGSGNATVTIETVTSMSVRTGTVRATGSEVFSAQLGDMFRLEALADEVSGIVTYTGYRNGEPMAGVAWPDSGGVAPTGVAWRRAGYGSSMFTNLNVTYPAAGADVFRCGDITS